MFCGGKCNRIGGCKSYEVLLRRMRYSERGPRRLGKAVVAKLQLLLCQRVDIGWEERDLCSGLVGGVHRCDDA